MVGIALHVPLGQSVWIGSITTERGLKVSLARLHLIDSGSKIIMYVTTRTVALSKTAPAPGVFFPTELTEQSEPRFEGFLQSSGFAIHTKSEP